MKVAVIGSRGLTISNLGDYLPRDTTEIISGGAKGVDTCARDYCISRPPNRTCTDFRPHAAGL